MRLDISLASNVEDKGSPVYRDLVPSERALVPVITGKGGKERREGVVDAWCEQEQGQTMNTYMYN